MADLKKIQDFIVKNRFGSDSGLKFKGNPKEYALKNFHPNGTHVFVTGMDGLGIWCKPIMSIASHNSKPVILTETYQEEIKDLNNHFEIDWSAVKFEDLEKFSESIMPDYSIHAIERSYERSDKPFIKVKEDVEELIDKAQDEMIDLSNQFQTFIIKGKNNLNVVGNLIKRGKDYVFRIITVMWKKFFTPKNPNDKVINVNEAKEISVNKKLLNLKEMNGGKSQGMSINDIAILHKVSVESIKQQLVMGIPVEAKEHSYDLSIAKQIAMDHLVENPNYYTEYIAKIESQEKKVKTEGILKEVEPVDVNQTIEEEPTAIVSEETQAKVELKREVQDVVNSLEDIIINAEEWNNAVPIKVNALSRINSILKATKSLALDLEASTNLISENVEKSKEVLAERRAPITDELKDYDFKFEKSDVEEVVASHYKLDSKKGGMIVVTIRNPRYDSYNPLSTMNYKMHIYYGDNYVGVYPDRQDEMGEKLAIRLEKEIIQDLAFMNAFELPDDFVNKHSEIMTEAYINPKRGSLDNDKEVQVIFNEIVHNFLLQTGIEIKDINSNQQEQFNKIEGQRRENYYYLDYFIDYELSITESKLTEKINALEKTKNINLYDNGNIIHLTLEFRDKCESNEGYVSGEVSDNFIKHEEVGEVTIDDYSVILDSNNLQLIKNAYSPDEVIIKRKYNDSIYHFDPGY